MTTRVKQTFKNLDETPYVGGIFAICFGNSESMGIITGVDNSRVSVKFLNHAIENLNGQRATFPSDTFQRCYGPLRPDNFFTTIVDDVYNMRLGDAQTEYQKIVSESDIDEMLALKMMSTKYSVEFSDLTNKIIATRYRRD